MTLPLNVFALKYGTLQLITAVEAAHHFDVHPESSVLILMRRLAGNPCIGDYPWGSVTVVDDRARGPLALRRLIRQRRYAGAVRRAVAGRVIDRLYLGLYSVETCGVANRLGAPAVTVLDDGTSTAYRSSNRVLDVAGGRSTHGRPMTERLRRLGGVDSRHLQQMNFFTMFEPELAPGDTYTRCALDFYASKMGRSEAAPQSMWLYGTNLVEMGHLDPARYTSIVRAAVEHAAPSDGTTPDVTYHPHPRENPEKIRALAAAIECRVAGGDVPIEMKLIDSEELPGLGIWSFPSSALVSSIRLIRDRVPCTMISVRDVATWRPIGEVEDAVTRDAGDAMTVVRASDLLD